MKRTQIHGGDIYGRECRIDFSANINPLGMPPKVAEAACAGVRMGEAYPDIDCRALRSALAEAEQVDEAQVICGNGAAELIYMLCSALRPGKALLTAPGFAEYELALRQAGCDCVFDTLRQEQGFTLQEDYLEKLTPDLDAAFLCNPNNPTGVLIPPKLLNRIIKRCEERRILLVLDECFVGLTGPEQKSQAALVPGHRYLFLLKAFTKLYAMPGLRLGYALSSDAALLDQMQKTVQPWNVSLPAQMAGIAALKEETYVKRSAEYIAGERERLKEALSRLGLSCVDSKANFICFFGPEDLGEACEREGMLLRDCSNYRGLSKGWWRIAVRRREENDALLALLQRILGVISP